MGSRSSLLALRTVQQHSLIGKRTFGSSANVLQEGETASPSITTPQRAADVVAALRRKVESKGSRSGDSRPRRQQQDRQSRPERSRQSASSQGTDRPPRRDAKGGFSRSGGGDKRGARSSAPFKRGQVPSRRGQEYEAVQLSPTPVQSIYPTTDWQRAASTPSVGYNRVPYLSPAVTLETLNHSNSDKKKIYPLHEAVKALKLHRRGGGAVMGPFQSPTPLARARLDRDDVPSVVRSSDEGSIAEESKEARVRLVQERFGGDYQRWEKSELVKLFKGNKASAAEGHAAEALTLNEDLGPAHKAWTMNTIKKILQGSKTA